MNYHRSPLEIIFEESTEYDDSGDSGVDELSDSETSQESGCEEPNTYMIDAFNQWSPGGYDVIKGCTEANTKLVTNQCLAVFQQLSLAGIVNRSRTFNIRK